MRVLALVFRGDNYGAVFGFEALLLFNFDNRLDLLGLLKIFVTGFGEYDSRDEVVRTDFEGDELSVDDSWDSLVGEVVAMLLGGSLDDVGTSWVSGWSWRGGCARQDGQTLSDVSLSQVRQCS